MSSMRVQEKYRNTDAGLMPHRGPEPVGPRESAPPLFRRTLTELTKEQHEQRLGEMKKGIEEQGGRLADRVCVKEYEKYRRLIREFLDEIVSNGYTFSREDAYASRGRHRFFATVKVVDEKLDQLGKEVLSDQADQIEILGKIDDIRGLLMDLMM